MEDKNFIDLFQQEINYFIQHGGIKLSDSKDVYIVTKYTFQILIVLTIFLLNFFIYKKKNPEKRLWFPQK